MATINSIVLVGNLTRDAEIKYTSGGTASVRFGIAQNRRVKSGDDWKDQASFFDVSMMGKGAEAVHKYLIKGKQVAIQGELRQDRWEKDGQPQSKVYVFALSVQLLGGDKGQKQEHNQQSVDSGVGEAFESDIPF